MTKYDLLDVLGTLDEKYLQEAEQRAKQLDNFDEEDNTMNTIEMHSNEKQRRFPVYFGATVAAGLALIVGATFFLSNRPNQGLTVPAASSPENSKVMTEVTVSGTTGNSAAETEISTENSVNVTTGSIAEAVTSTTTEMIENSMPDPTTTPAQTQDPSLITTSPENGGSLKENVFGGIGSIYIECKNDMLMFSDKSYMYMPDCGMQYPITDVENQLKVNGTKMKDAKSFGLNNGAQLFSDGRNLYAFDNFMNNKMIYQLYPDGSAWEDFTLVPFERTENIMVEEMTLFDGGYLFIFANCMNLDLRTNNSAYIYADEQWKEIPVPANNDGQTGFGSWHIRDGKLTICRPTDSQSHHYDFITYDLNADDPTKPERQIVDVDTCYVQNEAGAGYGAFCGFVNDEWCIDETNTIYFKSMEEEGNEAGYIYNLYRLDTQPTTAGDCMTGNRVKLCDHIGNYVFAPDVYIYTNMETHHADGSVSTDFVRYDRPDFSDPEVLLKNAKVLHATEWHSAFYLTLSSGGWETGNTDYLVYRICSEQLLVEGVYSEDDVKDDNFLTYFTGADWNGTGDHAPVPERARK